MIMVLQKMKILLLYLITVFTLVAANFNDKYVQVKTAGFSDPNTGYVYRVISYNMTSMTTDQNYRSLLRVSRFKTTQPNGMPIGGPENIQTIKFHPTLVDFDIHCLPTHCYLVAITSRTRRNVELYTWKRTQFDLLAKRDSFARPHGVKLFRINSGFYIVIAQDQLHLQPNRLSLDIEESVRFIGCAVFKFLKGHENDLKYHQFIKLPYHPTLVEHFVSHVPSNNQTGVSERRFKQNHYIVFSSTPNWLESSNQQAISFLWSPLNDYFWPQRLPRGVTITPHRGNHYAIINFPSEFPLKANLTRPQDHAEPIESCFNQLQGLLNHRDIQARRLIDSSRSIWRSSNANQISQYPANSLTNVSAQVIVHGNVIVKGSVIESPQITLIGNRLPTVFNVKELTDLTNTHSPAIVENRLRQASYKLKYIRDKLARAIRANLPQESISQFNSVLRFFGNIFANRVIFKSNGISNSDVRINGIPFKQLEHELVSLRGSQDIGANVVFNGNVVADLLEIHGTINQAYYLKDALDITSRRLQVIDDVRPSYNNRFAMEFNLIQCPELSLTHNTTVNGIRLDDLITKDDKTQLIYGRKLFKHLTMNRLNMAHPGVTLNKFNLTRLLQNAIHLQPLTGAPQIQSLSGFQTTFSRSIKVNRLIINNLVNRHINMSSLIHDSVKTDDVSSQLITGYKHFMNGLEIGFLNTEGSLNDVQVDQIFNLNSAPPVADPRFYHSRTNRNADPVVGRFIFSGPVTVVGNLQADLINGVELSKHVVLRTPTINTTRSGIDHRPQMVSGRKIFLRPLRVTNKIRLLDPQQADLPQMPYPLVNGLDLRMINAGIKRQMQNPSVVYIDNLEIEGNINLQTYWNQTMRPRAQLGNYSVCPLDVFRSRVVLGGGDDQIIDIPVSINTLRSRVVDLDPGALNGLNFPYDFVLKSSGDSNISELSHEPIFGQKSFENLVIVPHLSSTNRHVSNNMYSLGGASQVHQLDPRQRIVFGPRSSINNITHNELQTFIANERERNSTGEIVLQTLKIHGAMFAKRINGHHWPESILLKSAASKRGLTQLHRRIYSNLVFVNSTDLVVENQLVLRGPIQLLGRLNGVNITEFAHQSVTYGDKDLFSTGRPIRNKIFIGGLTVSEIRSQGLIDGINVDEMRNRVVTIGPRGKRTEVLSQKVFMSDIDFRGPLQIMFLNDLPLGTHLKRIQIDEAGNVRIIGKKSISGALRINKNLIVQGLINGIDFVDLRARAISLSSDYDEIQFNKTLTIDGDVFMDNLIIDEKNGIIDGVKLANLLPIDPSHDDHLLINEPIITRQNLTGNKLLKLDGSVLDCRISCSLDPTKTFQGDRKAQTFSYSNVQPVAAPFIRLPQQHQRIPLVSFPPQHAIHSGVNMSYMRTTPPYAMPSLIPVQHQVTRFRNPDPSKAIQMLAMRPPLAIRYELPKTAKKPHAIMRTDHIQGEIAELRKQIVSLDLIKSPVKDNIVIGFIESPALDLGNLYLGDDPTLHHQHTLNPASYLELDQIDFPFAPTTYHLSVGVLFNQNGQNITSVFATVGGNELRQLSVLPIEPSSAMFVKLADKHTLFLIVTQRPDSLLDRYNQCPRYKTDYETTGIMDYGRPRINAYNSGGTVHIYLFHSLQNSSSLTSAYFDLYQTMDLPAIDSLANFNFRGSTYALAVSSLTQRVYLLLLRGYSGFQLVSYFDAPAVEYVKVVYTELNRPALIIYLNDGSHRLLESVLV